MRLPEPVVLVGAQVRLEPLAVGHIPDLQVAGADPVLWRWLAVQPPVTLADMTVVVQAALDDPARTPWAVVVAGRAVGSTSYLDVDATVGGLEIGWTWYCRALWASTVNPGSKALLLAYAFEELGCRRVTLKTDALNTRSRGAISRLGASYDGTLRHHRLRADGSVRDTAYYSILAAEWPVVRAGLEARLSGPAQA